MAFEYKTVIIERKVSFWGGSFESATLDAELNQYGKEGWELISVVASNKTLGESGSMVCYFKRQI